MGSVGVFHLIGCSGRALSVPSPVVLLGERNELIRVEVANCDDERIVGRVETLEEALRIVVLLGHRFDVLEIAQGRVAIGMLGKDLFSEALSKRQGRAGRALVVLSQDRLRFGLEHVLCVFEVLEPVRLDGDQLLQVTRASEEGVAGEIIGRESVLVGTGLLEKHLHLVWRVLLRSSEHHVLEEVSKARNTRLDFVPRPDSNQRVVSDESRRVLGHHHQRQTIVELLDASLEGQDAGLSTGSRG
jgi:hypothetical protein